MKESARESLIFCELKMVTREWHGTHIRPENHCIVVDLQANDIIFDKHYYWFTGNELIVDSKVVNKIRVGFSNKKDIQELFGAPSTDRINVYQGSKVKTTWSYSYQKNYDHYIAGSFGAANYSLRVSFDDKGIVTSYQDQPIGGGGGKRDNLKLDSRKEKDRNYFKLY